jgi:hypothetical protein
MKIVISRSIFFVEMHFEYNDCSTESKILNKKS